MTRCIHRNLYIAYGIRYSMVFIIHFCIVCLYFKCIQQNLFWKHLISVKEKPPKKTRYCGQCSARNLPCSSSAVINLVYMVLFIYYVLNVIKSFIHCLQCMYMYIIIIILYWKKRMSTTLQVYTAKFILEASVSKRNPQRRQDIMDSALLETYHVRAAQ